MKKSFFILIALSTLSLSISQTPPPVRDTDGNIVRSGTNYYVLPVVNDKGGGITLAPRKDDPCPYDVAQENNRQRNGLPMNFVPAYTFKEDMIHESTDLNIRFAGADKCIATPVWRFEYGEDGIRIAKNGRRTLVLNNAPLKVKFKKA
ncbi:Kunitz trypsin inhibitor 2-like protein [Tanacetum coccineum]|uniref:Kunitz trypsin inhibitor 2-like protein n=1 Tax=Tanacetum coccineum TaxID=301880 RepID=A0ABQ4XVB2_9ASTR